MYSVQLARLDVDRNGLSFSTGTRQANASHFAAVLALLIQHLK